MVCSNAINREWGENPQQSRCGEFFMTIRNHYATELHLHLM